MDRATNSTAPADRLFCAVELSKNSWLLGIQFPDRQKASVYPLKGGDSKGLMTKLVAACDRWTKVSGKKPSVMGSTTHLIWAVGDPRGRFVHRLGFGIGWLLGGPGNDTRRVLALGTGQRNIAAALVVGTQSFSDSRVVVMVIVVAIVGLVMCKS